MKITKRQLKRIIREEYRRVVSRRRLSEQLFVSYSDDRVWEVELSIDYDERTGEFDEPWSILQDGEEVLSGNGYEEGPEALKNNHDKYAEELGGGPDTDDRDQIYYAINDVINQFNDWH